MRAWLARHTLEPSTEPTTTSPKRAGSTPVRSTSAASTAASKSSAGVSFRPPFLALQMGVRSAATTTTSSGWGAGTPAAGAPCSGGWKWPSSVALRRWEASMA